VYDNLTPNNLMGMASRAANLPGEFEVESADDFVLTQRTSLTGGAFTGLMVPGAQGGPTSADKVSVEIYRVFPADSTLPQSSGVVPTRVNSPSDHATASADSVSGLTFTSTTLAGSFTISNSIQADGIHPLPNQTTGGSGPLSGTEVQFGFSFSTPITLDPGQYFFVPQVNGTSGTQFYWLSADRPVPGLQPDLQTWTRNAQLAPDWLRVGTDIVGAHDGPAVTFNGAFSLEGTAVVPEPASLWMFGAGLGVLALLRRQRRV
jgi:hypothetical protein